jgi:hypothetical protein
MPGNTCPSNTTCTGIPVSKLADFSFICLFETFNWFSSCKESRTGSESDKMRGKVADE